MIRYLKHNDIDKKLWDQCISNAGNHLVDSLSWYLDITCPGWSALIFDNYKTVMPLPVRRKFGINYIFKPLFIQQLGLFGNNISEEMLSSFLSHLPDEIKLADIVLNESNKPEVGRYKMIRNKNYKLDIHQAYSKVQQQYHRNCHRNIKKAVSAGLKFTPSITQREFIDLVEKQIQNQVKTYGTKEKNQFRILLKETLNRGAGELVGVHDYAGNIMAAGFYLFSYDRLMFKICGSTSEGKNNQAMYLLIDEQIKRYSGKFKWYDFQGSNIEGIAYFNSTFGALPQIYYTLHINKLPNGIKILTGKN